MISVGTKNKPCLLWHSHVNNHKYSQFIFLYEE